jgi:hypothetical protein
VKFGIYAGVFLFGISIAVALEFAAMQTLGRFLFFLTILLGIAWWARRRWVEFASARYHRVQFEDLPTDGLVMLDIGGDTVAADEDSYIDAEDPQVAVPAPLAPKRPLRM